LQAAADKGNWRCALHLVEQAVGKATQRHEIEADADIYLVDDLNEIPRYERQGDPEEGLLPPSPKSR
jgi:hypothetical protein